MKVRIGKYLNYIGPYQIAEMILFWIPKYDKGTYEYSEAHDKYVHGFGKWLADTWVRNVCEWVYNKRKRTIKVRIDYYDVWSADHTLALIILPTLKKLKEVKHGAPKVEDVDVPWYLRSNIYTKENEWDTDPAWFKRYEWVLDEMIWTFEQMIDDDWESRYHHGKIDFDFKECEDNITMFQLEHGPNHTHWYDKEGHLNHSKCIDNGLRLFGKYYRGLWN